MRCRTAASSAPALARSGTGGTAGIAGGVAEPRSTGDSAGAAGCFSTGRATTTGADAAGFSSTDLRFAPGPSGKKRRFESTTIAATATSARLRTSVARRDAGGSLGGAGLIGVDGIIESAAEKCAPALSAIFARASVALCSLDLSASSWAAQATRLLRIIYSSSVRASTNRATREAS
jgi:hypothetical protein